MVSFLSSTKKGTILGGKKRLTGMLDEGDVDRTILTRYGRVIISQKSNTVVVNH